MNHSQVEFEEPMEVVGNDVIISTVLNGKDEFTSLYSGNAEAIAFQMETEVCESVDEDDETESSVNSSSTSDCAGTSSEDENGASSYQVEETYEKAKIGNNEFLLPRGLCENSSIFYEFFSLDTWNILPREIRMHLKKFLPKFSHLKNAEDADYEQEKTLNYLFKNQLKLFGKSPLQDIQENLEDGNYRPDVIEYHESIEKSKRRERRFQNCERLSQLAKELFISREKLLKNAYKSSPDIFRTMQKCHQKHVKQLQSNSNLYSIRARKRFHMEILRLADKFKFSPKELLSDEDDLIDFSRDTLKTDKQSQCKSKDVTNTKNNSVSNTEKKCIYNTFFKRRRGLEDNESIRIYYESMQSSLTNKNYRRYLLDYKKRKLAEPNNADFETSDIRLRDVCNRSQINGNFKKLFAPKKLSGRKQKPSVQLSNDPPALVPIQNFRKFDQVIQNDEIKNSLLSDIVDESCYSSVGNDHILRNANQAHSSHCNSEDNEVFNILGDELQNDVSNYNDDEAVPSFVLEKNPELPQNVLQAAVGSDEHPKKRPHKIDLSKILDTQKLPKLEPISNGARVLSGRPQPYVMKSSMLRKITGTSDLSTSPNSHLSSDDLIQETHACFFSLIRDFFCATPNHRMCYDDLRNKIDIWLRNPITALNEWFILIDDWSVLLPSAVKFLAGEFAQEPPEYVPYIEHKSHLNIYQWIGAGRDSDSRLFELCSFWLQLSKDNTVEKLKKNEDELVDSYTQNRVSEIESAHIEDVTASSPPPPRYPTNWTVRPATYQEIEEFHRQERERFENPHKAYKYRMYGYESVVGPVKGIYSQNLALSKARGHSIMVAERPNFVTILTLVRDATARLPNGEGTRADISELLKCSQYINIDAAENVLQSVVSGALDRMHTEEDPCVRYDAKRKMWIYLHRNRSIEEFEKMHHQNEFVGKNKKTLSRKPKAKTTILKESAINESELLSNNLTLKNGSMTSGSSLGNFTMPALVPANPVIVSKSNLISKQQKMQTSYNSTPLLPNCPPVPPLKYNIPTTIQQKSLLKSPQQMDVKRVNQITTTSQTYTQKNSPIVNSTNIANKPLNIALGVAKSPIVLTTTNGLQTVRVVNSNSGQTPVSCDRQVISATLGGKKVALNKPIIINQITQQTSPKSRNAISVKPSQNQQHETVLIPADSNISDINESKIKTMPNMYLEQSSLVKNPNSLPVSQDNDNLQKISQQQLPQGKSFIRLIPAINNSGPVKSLTATPQVNTGKQVQIIGPRVISNTAFKAATAQKSVGNLSSLSNNSSNIITSSTTNLNTSGAIVKMTPQAFAALQQKQIGQSTILVKQNSSVGSPPQKIVVGNTAILATNQTNKSITASVSHTATSVASQTKTINTQIQILQQQSSIEPNNQQHTQKPQVQPLQFKNLQILAGNSTQITQISQKGIQSNEEAKLQTQTKMSTNQEDHAQPGISRVGTSQSITILPQRSIVTSSQVSNMNNVSVNNKPVTVVVSQSVDGVTRLIKSTTTNASQLIQPQSQSTNQHQISNSGGQIITLENLLQKQGGTLRIAGNNTSIMKSPSSNLTNQIIQISGSNLAPQNTSNQQFTVVSQPRSIITLGANQRLITTQANTSSSQTVLSTSTLLSQSKEMPKMSVDMSNNRIVTSSSNAVISSPRVLGKATVMTSGGSINLSQLQGKKVLFASKSSAAIKNPANFNSTIKTGQIQPGNVILSGQAIKIQGNNTNILPINKTNAITASQPSHMQTLIVGNQILKVHQLPQTSNANQNRIVVSNSNTIPTTTIANSNTSGTILVNSSENIVNSNQTKTLPKTIVLGSPRPTIRLQATNSTTTQFRGNIKALVSTQQLQKQQLNQSSDTVNTSVAKTIGTLVTGKNAIATPNRVMFTVPGTNQIFLSSNIQGGPLNIKQLQNMKLVSINSNQQSAPTSVNNLETESNPEKNNSVNNDMQNPNNNITNSVTS